MDKFSPSTACAKTARCPNSFGQRLLHSELSRTARRLLLLVMRTSRPGSAADPHPLSPSQVRRLHHGVDGKIIGRVTGAKIRVAEGQRYLPSRPLAAEQFAHLLQAG